MNTATTADCPLCGLTVMARNPDPADAATAVANVLDEHLTEHHRQEKA